MKINTKFLFSIALVALLIAACNEPTKDSGTKTEVEHKASVPSYAFHPEWKTKLESSKMTGGVYVFHPKDNSWNVSDSVQLHQSFMPASTFKVITSMLALELGLVKDENEVLPWDKVVTDKPNWNHDMNMREALKLSTNWFYEGLVEEIGKDRMKQWLDKMEYPCNSIEDKDKFWIEEGFEVTPQEQIVFFKRIHDNQLPFSQRTLDITKSIMLRYDTLGVRVYAKTGWGTPPKQNIGWYVGWVEKGDEINYFATCIQQPDPNSENFGAMRIELTLDALKSLNIVPNGLVQ
jgi:beta-lactamase class D